VPDAGWLEVVVALAVLVGAAVQSATGFGFALISGPALFALLEPAEAVTALLVLGIAVNVLVVAGRGAGGSVRWPDLARVVVAALPGLVGGALLLGVVPKQVLQAVVGAGVLLAVALQVWRRPAAARPGPRRAPHGSAVVIGVLVGVLTTTTGTNGPPLVLWLERRRLAPADARRTISAVFLGLNVLGAVALAAVGRGVTGTRPALLGVLLVGAVAGYVAGAAVFRRMDPLRFRVAGLVLCTVAGLAALVSALTG
jgi:uncharacterized membrane protein YfcA